MVSVLSHEEKPSPTGVGYQYEKKDAVRARRILRDVMQDYSGPVAIRLGRDQELVGDAKAQCTIVLKHPSALRELILHQNLLRTAEAYVAGAIDVEGDFVSLFDLTKYFRDAHWSLPQRAHAAWDALHLPSETTTMVRAYRAAPAARRNSTKSISHHYDVGNEFYRLWLDPEMVYSCAYFRDAHQPLVEAQRNKLDYLCRKLRLAPGQRLLDIGCGWGALVLWAAKHYGVRAHGITLSTQQYEHANARVSAEGVRDQVTVELRDYRNLPKDAHYDRVVSVGMFEHIGVRNFDEYFQTVKRVLKRGGLFLNHGISNDAGWRRTPLTRFINRYIFPDGELTRISDVCGAMERAGFELLDVESLRRHYALTLERWLETLEAKEFEATKVTNDALFRLWRLYLAGSAYYFGEGSLNVYQVLAGSSRSSLATPLTRDDLYVPH